MSISRLKISSVIVILAAGVLVVSGCSKDKTTNSSPGPPPQHQVNISNFAFTPLTMTIAMGDTVTWKNNDGVSHTVTSDAGTELNGQVGSGGTYQHIFQTAGSFSYHCTIHPTMTHGTITVQ